MAFAGLGCLGMPWAILAALLLLCFAEGAQAKALARDSQAVPKAKEGNSIRQACSLRHASPDASVDGEVYWDGWFSGSPVNFLLVYECETRGST